MADVLDLFGDPVPPHRGKRGRPQHIPTQENRNKVSMLLALGWNNERIAASLRCTLPTLRKHYFSELKFREVARDRLEAARFMIVWGEAQKGNIAAVREFGAMMDKNDVMAGHRDFYQGQRVREDDDRPAKIGKKEEAALAAASAGEDTDWGSDLKPPMN